MNTSSDEVDAGSELHLILGVDAGGSKTRAWLAVQKRQALHIAGRATAGPGNPQTLGIEAAGRNVLHAIHAAFTAAKLPLRPVQSACLALAGVGRKPLRDQILCWARDARIGQRIHVVHDAQAVLAAGTNAGTGVALICGTGSFAYGETKSGKSARSGGWGYLWGDEGSGYAVGAAALRAVARAFDQRGPVTQLTDAVLEQFHVAQPPALIPAVHGTPDIRRAIAAIAPCVFAAAERGDTVAQQICQDAATELALLIRGVTSQLDFTANQYDLAVSGGLSLHCPSLISAVTATLASLGCPPRHTEPVAEPVAGALALAAGDS